MSFYSVIVMLHVLTATGMFMAWAVEWAVGNIKGAATIHRRMVLMGMVAMVLTILSGIFLMMKTWGGQPWLTASIINLIGIIAVGLTVGKRKPKAVLAFKLVLGVTILALMSLKAATAITGVLTISGWVFASVLALGRGFSKQLL